MVMRALSTSLGVTPTTITGLVDALEADGWVIRQPHPTDRRAIVIALTPAAADTYSKLEETYRRFATLLLSDIDQRDLERALVVVDHILARLDEATRQAEEVFEAIPAMPRKGRQDKGR
jgi:DNA-binding MarR family transcriptional regulator